MKNIPFYLDKESNQPIYQQIIDQVTQMVSDGTLAPGDQLPTGQEWFQSYGIARGTVRYAYSQLSKNGVISVLQGKGSFIRGKEPTARTINTIDYYLDEFDQFITLDDLELLIQRKVQDRIVQQQVMKVLIVESCLELRDSMIRALSDFPDISISAGTVESLFADPAGLHNQDLIIMLERNLTSVSKEDFFQNIKDFLIPISMNFAFETIKQLAALPIHSSIGVFCRTKRYFEISRWELAALGQALVLQDYFIANAGSEKELSEYLVDKNVLLTAGDPRQYTSDDQFRCLEEFQAGGGQIISLLHVPDVGSMLHIEEYVCQYRITRRRLLY